MSFLEVGRKFPLKGMLFLNDAYWITATKNTAGYFIDASCKLPIGLRNNFIVIFDVAVESLSVFS
jgi:hypothetical protein